MVFAISPFGQSWEVFKSKTAQQYHYNIEGDSTVCYHDIPQAIVGVTSQKEAQENWQLLKHQSVGFHDAGRMRRRQKEH